jgi:hypothetical protein
VSTNLSIADIHQQVADLLRGPRPVRVRGHAEDMHLPGTDLDHEEAVQAQQGHRAVHVEEVSRKHRRGLRAGADESRRWRLVAEFLEEYRWELAPAQLALLDEEPAGTGDERWDVFLPVLAEHLTARDGQSAPAWAESRSLHRLWFPFNSRAARVDAVVHARRHFVAGGCMSRRRSWRSRERG